MNIIPIIVTLMCCLYTTEAARILGVFPVPSHSHTIMGFKLMQGLAEKGHEVTMISAFPQKKPLKNWRDIELSGFVESFEESQKYFFEEAYWSFIECEFSLHEFVTGLTEEFFKQKSIEELLKSNEKFDMVIVEEFTNFAMYGFCYRFNAVCVSFSTVGLSRFSDQQVGNPLHPAYMSDYFLPYGSNMNFFERAYNSFAYLFGVTYKHLYVLPDHNKILQKYFPGAPYISDLYFNASLMIVNAHISTNPAVPYVPNMIEVGGIHVVPPKPLRKDLQEFLDNAKEGAILFSLGSNLRSADLAVENRDAILTAFSKLKQKVLWKWEEENLPGKPANVKIEKWLPQSDVLAHPNIKLFITHGGLLSTIETIYHGIPVVGIPVFGDQRFNMANAINNGFGLSIPYSELTEEKLSTTLQEVLTNPKYTENAKMRSKIMHDQPMKPQEKGVFWIEYVLRHNGAPHLRSAGLNLAWYQYLLLDVVLVVVLTSFVVIASIYFGIKFVCCKNKHVKVSKAKKRN